MQCRSCGTELPEDVRFCPTCGIMTPYKVSGPGISANDQTDLSSSTPVFQQGLPATYYNSPFFGMSGQNPYEQNFSTPNAYASSNPYDIPPPPPPPIPPQRRVKIGLLRSIIVLVLIIIGMSVVGFLIFPFLSAPIVQTNVPATATAATKNPYATSGTLTLSDPLQDNSKGYGWEEYSSNSNGAACQFTGEGYHDSEQQNYFNSCYASSLQFTDFTFEVQMKITTGTCGGVAFRDTPSLSHAYFYEVCVNGLYYLYRVDGTGAPKTILTQYSPTIHTDPNQSNLLAVVTNGCNMTLFVNKQSLSSSSDCTYASGQVGVVTDAFSESVYTFAKAWIL